MLLTRLERPNTRRDDDNGDINDYMVHRLLMSTDCLYFIQKRKHYRSYYMFKNRKFSGLILIKEAGCSNSYVYSFLSSTTPSEAHDVYGVEWHNACEWWTE
jgi:hypothetical protein